MSAFKCTLLVQTVRQLCTRVSLTFFTRPPKSEQTVSNCTQSALGQFLFDIAIPVLCTSSMKESTFVEQEEENAKKVSNILQNYFFKQKPRLDFAERFVLFWICRWILTVLRVESVCSSEKRDLLTVEVDYIDHHNLTMIWIHASLTFIIKAWIWKKYE